MTKTNAIVILFDMKALPIQTYNSLVEQIGKIYYEKYSKYPTYGFIYKNENTILIGVKITDEEELIYTRNGNYLGTIQELRKKGEFENFKLQECYLFED
ncbi:MAG: hypothetical protein C0169_00320 [Thermodesulfobacterium geofontis]|uniref:Uncharacterized protein n=1 Tax=Thermodesulfobacterium geofontis TaxID=1295609 RepID=A0A2N7QGP1_9BACT|nr:MAG: hypothetical protein C0169_00320 [Thermodesulfobacterium geofontis]